MDYSRRRHRGRRGESRRSAASSSTVSLPANDMLGIYSVTPITDVGDVTAEPYGAMPCRALGPAQRLGQQENHHGTRTRLLLDE
jgi:hypothetical protein